jgi:hypothetical protein
MRICKIENREYYEVMTTGEEWLLVPLSKEEAENVVYLERLAVSLFLQLAVIREKKQTRNHQIICDSVQTATPCRVTIFSWFHTFIRETVRVPRDANLYG